MHWSGKLRTKLGYLGLLLFWTSTAAAGTSAAGDAPAKEEPLWCVFGRGSSAYRFDLRSPQDLRSLEEAARSQVSRFNDEEPSAADSDLKRTKRGWKEVERLTEALLETVS